MAEFFQSWTPYQFTMLVMTVCITAGVIVFILSIAHYQLRALADHTALERERAQAAFTLRQDLVRRGLPAAELRAALDALGPEPTVPAAVADGELTAQLLQGLVACGKGVSAGDIEATVASVTAADPATRRAVAELLETAVDDGYEGEPVFATVRAACRAAGPKPAAGRRPEPEYAAG